MSSYRQIRRQTRRARRAGLQPIVVIDHPFPVARRGDPGPVGVAVPLRDRARHHGGRGPRGGLVGCTQRTRTGGLVLLAVSAVAACALVAFGARVGLARLAERVYAGTAALAAGGVARGRRLLGPFTSPIPQVLALGAAHPRGSMVGAPSPAGEGTRAADARRLAGHLQGDRPARFPDPVRERGPVGLAGPPPPGPRADHRRRDRADTSDRIGARHLPRRGARPPDPRRQGQPVRTAGARHRPARRSDPLARAVRPVHHPAGRPRPVRGRRTVPRVVPAPARAVRRHHRVGQERRPQRAHGHPGRLRQRGHLGHRPQERHGTRPLGALHRPARHHPRRGRRAARRRGAPSCRHVPRG